MSKYNKDLSFLGILGYLYIIISQVMTLYFWWQWAQDHSFVSTIFLGPIVSELKGLLWIFFIW